MITIDDLKTAGIADDKAQQILTDLGDFAKKLTPENVAKKAFDQVDLAILNMTKIPKGDNEMTTDYLKRATKDMADKQITEKTTELNQKIIDAEEKLKNHKGDETLKEEIRLLKEEKSKLPDLKNEWVKEWKEKAEAYEKQIETIQKTNELKGVMPVKFKSELDKEFIDFKINQVLDKTIKTYTQTETDSKGNLWLVDPVKIDKVLAKEYFDKELGSIVDKGVVQPGGGGGNGQQQQQQMSELKIDATMSSGEKINKITEYIITQKGIDKLDPTWDKIFNEELKTQGLEQFMTVKDPEKK